MWPPLTSLRLTKVNTTSYNVCQTRHQRTQISCASFFRIDIGINVHVYTQSTDKVVQGVFPACKTTV